MQTLSPVKTGEREIFMDKLRGSVIPGIIIHWNGCGEVFTKTTGNSQGVIATAELLAYIKEEDLPE